MRNLFFFFLVLTTLLFPLHSGAQSRFLQGGDTQGGVTASDVVADPSFPYENYFKDQSIGGANLRPKLGSGTGYIEGVPEFRLNSGWNAPFLQKGFNPDDALLKLGILYLDVDAARLSIFHTDNAGRTANNRKSETVGIFSFGINVLVQFTEGLQLSTSGKFIWLPFSNDAGIEGFGLYDTIDARFGLDGGGTPFSAGLSYDATIADWDLRLADNFQADFINGFFGLRGEFVDEFIVAEPQRFNPETDTTRISLGGLGAASTSRNGRSAQTTLKSGSSLTTDSLVLRNTLSGLLSKQYVTQTRITVSAIHQNSWYAAQNTVDTYEDAVAVNAVNERDNMRFKPFASYNISKRSTVEHFEQSAAVGLFGPISDYIDFLGSAGWARAGANQAENYIWRTVLDHDISPFTSHQAAYSRQTTVADPNRDLATTLTYRITQVLGPRMDLQVYARKSTFEDLDGNLPVQKENTIGVRLLYNMSTRTRMSATGTRTSRTLSTAGADKNILYSLRCVLAHQLSDTMDLSIFYSYEKQIANQARQGFYENLIGLSLTKQL
ncbi:hypothetical protein N9B94_00760 [Verrucomicrobia bacterium]|nr:hypothetical protein [Verrucomicrobiota bacterium]